MNAIAALGRRVIERVQGIGVATLMLLQILFSMPTWLGVKLFIYQMYRVGVLSLLIIMVSGLFIGAVLGLQMFSILSTFGSESMLGQRSRLPFFLNWHLGSLLCYLQDLAV